MYSFKKGERNNESLRETTDNYVKQIAKYQKIVLNNEWSDKDEVENQEVMMEHKKKLIDAKARKDYDAVIEVLLSLRVNALQISPELRKNLVYELIRNDVLCIEELKANTFALDLLAPTKYNLRHAVLSLISILAATYKGVEYMTDFGDSILCKIIDILKHQENGTVVQRFCIAILQKMSVKESTIQTLIENELIEWIVQLLKTAQKTDIHIFCLDFSSALLANILHSNVTLDMLEKNQKFCQEVSL